MLLRSIVAPVLAAVLMIGSVSIGRASAASGQVTLLFYDRNGTLLSPEQVRSLSNNGTRGYNNDLLVDPTTLQAIMAHPFQIAGNRLVFPVSGRPVALALNWPTEPHGYSLLLLDNGGKGFTTSAMVNFTYQAARDVRRKLRKALAVRPDYRRSAAFNAAYNAATTHLNAADASPDPAIRGQQGQLALDQLAVAYNLLLAEHGAAFAHSHRQRPAPWLGVTLDTVAAYPANLDLAAMLTQPYGWIRIVFDAGQDPSTYREMVAYAESHGLKILGQPVDSSYDKKYSRAQYLQRFQDFLAAFPNIDAWEVGNEVNGGRLSPEIALKVADAAAYCRSQGKVAVLTLFWQLNTDTAEHSVFTWIRAHLPTAVRRDLNVVLLSIYPEHAPLGIFFDQLMLRMRAEFLAQKIGIGELGYWIPGQQFWWAYSRSDPDGTARHAVAAQYYPASLDYPGSIGGVFWWNFIKEFSGDPEMQAIVRTVRDKVQSGE